MDNGIEFLSDGTVNFYQNKTVNLISAISSLLGLIVFALIIFFLGLYEEKIFVLSFCFISLIQIPVIIFFLVRFFKPKIIFVLNSQGVEIYGKKLTWEQISFAGFEGDLLIFKSKDNRNYRFLTNAESRTILKEIFSKHGFSF